MKFVMVRILAILTLMVALAAAVETVRSVKRHNKDASNRKQIRTIFSIAIFYIFVQISSFLIIHGALLTRELSAVNFAAAFLFMAAVPIIYTIVLLAIALVYVWFGKK